MLYEFAKWYVESIEIGGLQRFAAEVAFDFVFGVILILGFVVYMLLKREYIKATMLQKRENICDLAVFWHCTKQQRRKVLSLLSCIPKETRLVFSHQGYRISILDHKYYVDGPDAGVEFDSVGMFCPASKIIFIDAGRDMKSMKDTIFHEFAHFCDWLAGNEQDYKSEANEEICKLYAELLFDAKIPEYYRSNAQEFVAYCASKFYCKPSVLDDRMLAIGKACFEDSFEKAKSLGRSNV